MIGRRPLYPPSHGATCKWRLFTDCSEEEEGAQANEFPGTSSTWKAGPAVKTGLFPAWTKGDSGHASLCYCWSLKLLIKPFKKKCHHRAVVTHFRPSTSGETRNPIRHQLLGVSPVVVLPCLFELAFSLQLVMGLDVFRSSCAASPPERYSTGANCLLLYIPQVKDLHSLGNVQQQAISLPCCNLLAGWQHVKTRTRPGPSLLEGRIVDHCHRD